MGTLCWERTAKWGGSDTLGNFDAWPLSACGVATQGCSPFLSEKSEEANSLKNNGEPGRTRTCNPLLTPEMLCSWFFMHFLASCITVLHGVRKGFVPKVVPNFLRCTPLVRQFSWAHLPELEFSFLLPRILGILGPGATMWLA